MNTTIYTWFLIVVLFFAQNVMNYLGINNNYVYAVYLAMAFVSIIFNKRCFVRRNTNFAFLIFIVSAVGFLKLILDRGSGARNTVLNIMCAPVVLGCFPAIGQNNKFWRNASKAIIYLYIIECGLTLLERGLIYNFFPWKADADSFSLMEIGEISTFRSSALLGHPLQNALFVMTIMPFFLCSNYLKTKQKALLWIFGYLAILCFNTRSSIVGAPAILALYIVKEYITNKKMSFLKRNAMIIGVIIVSICLIGIASYYQLGGRLMEMGLVDIGQNGSTGSAQVRIDVFSIFNYYDISDFLWGNSMTDRDLILYSSGILLTENFWIDYLLSIGLIPLLSIIISYILVLKYLYRGYKPFVVFITILSFLATASTNNSLSVDWMPLFLYLIIICIYSYKEKLIN